MTKEYFIGSDDDGHYYVVENDKRAQWWDWLELDKDDPESWNVPEFATRIDNPNTIVFKEFRDSND